MSFQIQDILIVALATPFVGFAALMLTRFHRFLYITFAFVAPLIMLAAVFAMLAVFASDAHTARVAWTALTLWGGLTFGFSAEPLGLLFAGVVGILWPVSVLYSLAYLRVNNIPGRAKFCALFSLSIGAAIGVAFADNLLTMLVFYELLTFATYPLITFVKSGKTKRGARVYLGYLLGSSIALFLPAIVWIQAGCGTLTFTAGGFVGDCVTAPNVLLLLFVYGAGKAALIPIHRWLPAAMVAPAPVSALLHAVAVVKTGVFVIMKSAIFVFGYDFLSSVDIDWLVYLSGGSMLLASLFAMTQDSIKKMLAYSTVSHLGYIVMGVALLQPATLGMMLHFIAHAFAKITLFFAAGAIQSMTGKTRVSELQGMASAMPWTMVCFAIAAAALVGLPPLSGFVSKWFLLQGMMQPPHLFAIGAIVLSTLLNLAYFGRAVMTAFAPPPVMRERTRTEAPGAMVAAMAVPAIATVIFPLFVSFVVATLVVGGLL